MTWFDLSLPLWTLQIQMCADLERPNMKVAALENVQQCRFILPEEMEESLANKEIAPHKSKVHLCISCLSSLTCRQSISIYKLNG